MDLVGTSTPTVTKLRLAGKPADRYDAMLATYEAILGYATWSSPEATSQTSLGNNWSRS